MEPQGMGALRALCDRRDLLRVGAITLAAQAVPADWLLAADESATGSASPRPAGGTRERGVAEGRARSVIVLWMAGGVTHIDSFDPKPQAPAEVRGVLGDIPTSVPGIRFCETLPQLSRLAHELAVIRNFSHDSDDHLLSQVYTLSGRKVNQNQLFTEPNVGSIVSYLCGPRNGLPAEPSPPPEPGTTSRCRAEPLACGSVRVVAVSTVLVPPPSPSVMVPRTSYAVPGSTSRALAAR